MAVIAVGMLLAPMAGAHAAVAPTRPAAGAGALPIGTASYPVPSGAIFASPSGSDTASGAQASPVKTLAKAISLAPAGGTVVMRAGSYHETIAIYKAVTIQNYPGEAVWMDGSEPVTGWVADGAAWRKDGWTTRFDASPTYTKGAPDGTAAGWSFVDAVNYPMAAHPDQVFINGVQLAQVKSRALVGPGRFFLDEATSKLYVGTNPGTTARATTLAKAINARADNVTIRGIGVRNYATSVYMVASVVMEKNNAVVENVRVSNSATTGLSVIGLNGRVSHVTLDGAGMLGMHANYADGLLVDGMDAYGNNSEHFNMAPVSGGMKFGHTRGITVKNSSVHDNNGPGLWTDVSCYNVKVVGNDFTGNGNHGVSLELSAKFQVVNNLFSANAQNGIKVNNTSDGQLWNNTFVGNGRPIWLVQDSRRNTNPNDAAVDKRQPWPQLDMPWETQNITVADNVMTGSPTGTGMIAVEDYSRKETAEQMAITLNGNLYNRASATQPQWTNVWSKGTIVNPLVTTTLAAFKTATGQEARGAEYTTTAVIVGANGMLATSVNQASIALPLPADLATLAGKTAGSSTMGAWDLATPIPPLATVVSSAYNTDGNRQLISTSASEITNAAAYGYAVGVAQKGKVSAQTATGLTAIRRTYNATTHEFRWVPEGKALASGFVVQKTEFYAPLTSAAGLLAVYRMTKGGFERLAFGDSDRNALASAGWVTQNVLFYVGATG